MIGSKLPKRINSERLCQHGDRLQGQMQPKEMPRLLEMVENIKTPAKVLLEFKHDESGLAIVVGVVEITLELICQRCMQPYHLDVKSPVNWAIVNSDAKAKAVPQQFEPILEYRGHELELLIQLEDEIILNIPIIPMHENLDDCVSLASYQDSNKELKQAERAKNNPFASLANLKKK